MSAIPPTWLSGIVQSSGAQTRADEAKRREARSAVDEKGVAERGLVDVVETGDHDAGVFSDAEGRGSNGRASGEGPSAETDAQASPDAAQSSHGLDVQA